MSIKVMDLVWENSKNKGSALLLELAIADHAHDDGTGAWPSVETLAKKTRMTVRNTQMLLRKLESSKEVETRIGAGPFGCNAYAINIKILGAKSFHPPKTFQGERARARGVKSSAPRVKTSAKGVKSSAPNRVKPTSPKQNRQQNRQKNRQKQQQHPDKDPGHDLMTSGPSVVVVSKTTNPGLIAHYAERMNIHFGIDPNVARNLAALPHMSDAYLKDWEAFSERNIDEHLSTQDTDRPIQYLGPGYYVDRIKAGDVSPVLAKYLERKEREEAHSDDPVWAAIQKERSRRKHNVARDSSRAT